MDFRPLPLARLDVAQNPLLLLAGDLGPLGGGGVERVAQLLRTGPLDQARNELVVNGFLHEQPASGTAGLPLVEEQSEVRALYGGIEVGIGKDHIGAFATQFQADTLQVAASGRLHDDLARGGLPRESHLVHIHVAGEGRPRGGTKTGHHIDDAIGEPSLQGKLGDA